MMQSASRRRPLVKAGAIGFIVSIAVVGLGPVGNPSNAQVGCDPDWSLVPSPPAKNVNGFAAVSQDDVWAVGIDFGSPEHTFTEHWNGDTWSVVPSANVGTGDNALNKAAFVSGTDGWAVGYSAPGDTSETSGWRTLVERWTGGRWSVVSSPNPTPGSNSLTGVAALSPSAAWAVGYHKTDAARQTLIERWNGTGWTVVTSPSPGGITSGLTAVSAASSANVWAVGYQSDGVGYRSLVEHWDGTAWRVIPSANVGSGDNVLMGTAAVSSNDVWAVGYRNVGSEIRTLIERWNGSTWGVVPSPNRGFGLDVLLGVSAGSASDVWAVGFSYDPIEAAFVTLTQRWDGSAWSIVPSPNGDERSSHLIGAAFVPGGQVLAGGRSGPNGLMMTICPADGGAAGSAKPAVIESRGAFQAGDIRPAPGSISSLTRDEGLDAAVAVVAEDTAAEAGIYELTKSRGAVVFDLDNDGRSDIFLGRHQQPARLYRNDGTGHFSEIDVGTFGRHDRHGCAAIDVNRDGRPDIACSVGASKGTDIKSNELWMQGAGYTFADEAARFGVMDIFGRGRNLTVIDVNADGYSDLYAGNEGDRPDGLPAPSRLFINVGGTAFRGAPEYGLDLETGSGCGQAADFNNDGWGDLLLCTRDGLALYQNDQGVAFTDVSAAMRVAHNPSDAELIDLDGDGLLDMVEVTRRVLRVELRRGAVFRTVFRLTLPAGLGVAVGDVNGDEQPDIYVLQGAAGSNDADIMLLNDGGGTSFTKISIPVTNQGRAESVEPIDYDRNGLTDFLVQNGNGTSNGPVQLIAFFAA